MKKILHALSAIIFTTSLNAQTVVEIIENSPDHTALESAVIAADLATTLSDPNGSFTVFAPTDDAFADLPSDILNNLLNNPTGRLAEILKYHVLGSQVLSSSLSDGQTAPTLQSEDITVSITGSTVMINDAVVTVADIQGSNGVVHVIDAVMLPPSYSLNVAEVVVNSPDHTTLEAAVTAANLVSTLSDQTANYTLFAPTDAAFNALPSGVVDRLLLDPTGDLASILLYHTLGSEAPSGGLTDGQVATTSQGEDITIGVNSGTVTINGATVSVADIQTLNGIVHVIDAVILPPTYNLSVVDIIVNSTDHDTLETAVIAAGLVTVLSNPADTFTVFAPTDDAFAALPAGLLSDLLDNPSTSLTEALTYHVLGGTEALSSTLTSGQVTTLQGEDISVTINGANVLINDANVTVADITALNGVVHVIDAVLVPNTLTSSTELEAQKTYEILNSNEFISIMANDKISTVELYDITGKVISFENNTNSTAEISKENLQTGTYFIRFKIGETNFVEKIIF